MRAAAEEARERAEKADEGMAQNMKQIHKLQHKVIGYSMNPVNLCVKDLFGDDDGNEHL